jgi:tocopherol O-methyltransferase
MITSRKETTSTDVAGHYDDLDRFYREIWGDHVHHGLWRNGREKPDEAVEQLIDAVAAPLNLTPDSRICDVGCGYGGTSRYLAEKYEADVTGLTISKAQFEYAQSQTGDRPSPRFLLQNWEENELEDNSLDGLVSIECLAHVVNKDVYFEQVYRVLKPGCRASITAWLSGDAPKRWEERRLLEPICREGRCPSMGTRDDYVSLLESRGLRLISYDDMSEQVKKTWRICARRVQWRLCTRPDYWKFLFTRQSRHAIFLVTLYRIMLAYRTGAMRYGHFVMEKSIS